MAAEKVNDEGRESNPAILMIGITVIAAFGTFSTANVNTLSVDPAYLLISAYTTAGYDTNDKALQQRVFTAIELFTTVATVIPARQYKFKHSMIVRQR